MELDNMYKMMFSENISILFMVFLLRITAQVRALDFFPTICHHLTEHRCSVWSHLVYDTLQYIEPTA